jgi:cell division protein FtsZ
MAFITCGMGGGTGTGGAPVVAKICRELGILTVGIVTLPFSYEGRKRMKQAQEGIDRMREHVDTILVISNDKLRQQFGNLPFTQAFAKADNVLATAAKCITDVITTSGQVNVDFADVTTVMKNGGVAILGNATIAGENRALRAVEEALNSPLLNDNDIRGAKWILLNVTSAPGEFEHTLDELDEVQAYVQQMAGDNCDLIMGVGHDPALEDRIGVTVIATGFNHKEITDLPVKLAEQPAKISLSLDGNNRTSSFEPVQKVVDPLMPTLVDNTPTTPNFSSLKPLPVTENKDRIELKMEDNNTPKNSFAAKEEEGAFQLVIKEEPQPASQYDSFTIGEHRLSNEELEERRMFEEQKRQLEERAERLRKLSFNIKGGEADDMENVPAYMRRSVNLNNTGSSSDSSMYSGYSVGVNDQGNQASIQTINTFLDGKKPD